MRILIVGNDPHEIGGVANYTRPLARQLTETGHDVFYFYSGAFQKSYNWLFLPYLRIDRVSFPFECAEVVNSPNLAFNFNHPELDINSPKVEKIFIKYLKQVRPEVIHIHSRCGLPFSIAKIAHDFGIRVFNSIHVYGLLCQKRVMIDHGGVPCAGPADIKKCTDCSKGLNAKKLKLTARIDRTHKGINRILIFLKSRLTKIFSTAGNFGGSSPSPRYTDLANDSLEKRLRFNIDSMNRYVHTNICVSEDVKSTLIRYGVDPKRLLVQHIGSAIAECQRENKSMLHSPIVIGNIGGVNYYKGTHILVDAITKMKSKNFVVKIFGKYQQKFVDQIMKGRENLPILFLGKYLPTDLPTILHEIDIMVLPSICNDTAPQTIFESFSHGVPIVASYIGGFPDFVKNDRNGMLFESGNSEALAAILDQILSDPSKIITYRKNIPRLKTIEENARELIALFQQHSATK